MMPMIIKVKRGAMLEVEKMSKEDYRTYQTIMEWKKDNRWHFAKAYIHNMTRRKNKKKYGGW